MNYSEFTRRSPAGMLALMIAVIMAVIPFSGCASASGTANQEGAASGTASEAEDSRESDTQDILKVEILKVGKADAMVLMCGGRTMIIDCGEEEDGEEVLEYLEKQGIQKVDIMLITHFDKDHVGGADTVVEEIAVDRIILPAYEGNGDEYADFIQAVQEAGITPERVTETLTLQLGSASVTVEPPSSYEIEDSSKEYDNNFSLISTVEFGSDRLVFTGDIEKKRIREWLEEGTAQKCDVLKVPHHGSYNAALEEMLAVLQPSYAVICDSGKNPAEDKTLELLQKYGVDCLETKNGDITILCDGENIEVRQ